MKHIKLFEQVDWDNDPFGEDWIPYELQAIRYNNTYYIIESITTNAVYIISNHRTMLDPGTVDKYFVAEKDIPDKAVIRLFNYGDASNKDYTIKTLPKEIKDRLI